MPPAAQASTAPEDAQSRQWGHVGLPPDPAPNTTRKTKENTIQRQSNRKKRNKQKKREKKRNKHEIKEPPGGRSTLYVGCSMKYYIEDVNDSPKSHGCHG